MHLGLLMKEGTCWQSWLEREEEREGTFMNLEGRVVGTVDAILKMLLTDNNKIIIIK